MDEFDIEGPEQGTHSGQREYVPAHMAETEPEPEPSNPIETPAQPSEPAPVDPESLGAEPPEAFAFASPAPGSPAAPDAVSSPAASPSASPEAESVSGSDALATSVLDLRATPTRPLDPAESASAAAAASAPGAVEPQADRTAMLEIPTRGETPGDPAEPPRRRPPSRRAIAAAIAAVCVLSAGLALAWYLLWRDVDVTVNGSHETVRTGTQLDSFLNDHRYFGSKPGRLLSIGGNVIADDGGHPRVVRYDGSKLSASGLKSTRVHQGAKIELANGADAEEGHVESSVDVAPGVQMGRGGAVQFVSRWGKAGKQTVWTGRRSGEVVNKEVVEQPIDMVVSSINLEPKAAGPCIALTFDDGPSSYTSKILSILAQKGVKATFFNLGNSANKNPGATKAVVDAGNELGNHTMSHPQLPKLDRETMRGELSRAFDALRKASGTSTQLIRAPYGAFTATEWARSADLIGANILWNIDTRDWSRPGAVKIGDAVLNNARNGSIVLMHDGGGDRSQDIQALPGIIDGLKARGFRFVTVSEMMELDGNVPDAVIKGTVSMPEDAALPAD